MTVCSRTTPLFLWVLWLNIGLALSVCVVLEGLLLSVDSVFITVLFVWNFGLTVDDSKSCMQGNELNESARC